MSDEPSSGKEWHLGHVPGTVIVDKDELDKLRAEVERSRDYARAQEEGWRQSTFEVERLRAVADAARAFVEQHQIGQPGTPGTLYPMTYGVQDAWHEEWDRRLAALIAACQT